jgi:hypothetical protein
MSTLETVGLSIIATPLALACIFVAAYRRWRRPNSQE